MSYDSAITTFSPAGNLQQVEYAVTAVKGGACSVGVCVKGATILAVEHDHFAQKKTVTKLQEARTDRKVVQLDDHIFMAYSGLNADGRIMANKARIECQSYRLNYDDAPTVEYISKFMGETKQKYTQRGGVRPFGISCLVAGYDANGTAHLFTTDPSGTCSEWKANSVGRNSDKVCRYLEANYKEDLSYEDGLKLAVRALMDVVESGNKNIELFVVSQKENRKLTEAEIDALIASLNA